MAEKNNPVLPVTESAGKHGVANVRGTVDSGYNGETAEVIDVTAAKSQNAPKNPAPDWSA